MAAARVSPPTQPSGFSSENNDTMNSDLNPNLGSAPVADTKSTAVPASTTPSPVSAYAGKQRNAKPNKKGGGASPSQGFPSTKP
jgi:hypothetical protein